MTDDPETIALLLELQAFRTALLDQKCVFEAELITRAGSKILQLTGAQDQKQFQQQEKQTLH